MNLLTPIILLVASAGIFFGYIDPTYKFIKRERQVMTKSDEVLNLADEISSTRDQLLNKNNAITDEQKASIEKALPDSADNVKLIIDIQEIARKHNVSLTDVVVSAPQQEEKNTSPKLMVVGVPTVSYGTVGIEMSFASTYQNFIDFMADLESSLRLIDINSLKFEASDTSTYKFNVSISSYWLM